MLSGTHQSILHMNEGLGTLGLSKMHLLLSLAHASLGMLGWTSK